MERTGRQVEDVLSSFDGTVATDMAALHDLIDEAMGNPVVEVWEGIFWSGSEQTIIGYGPITQPRPRGEDVDWFAVGLARQKDHYSIYVNAADGDGYLTKQYAGRLGTAKVGAAAITFRSLDGVDLDALRDLLERATPTT